MQNCFLCSISPPLLFYTFCSVMYEIVQPGPSPLPNPSVQSRDAPASVFFSEPTHIAALTETDTIQSQEVMGFSPYNSMPNPSVQSRDAPASVLSSEPAHIAALTETDTIQSQEVVGFSQPHNSMPNLSGTMHHSPLPTSMFSPPAILQDR